MMLVGGLLAPASLIGCSVDPLELNGRRCPCVSGYRCDPATQLCVPVGQGVTGGSGAGAGGAGAGGADTGGGGGSARRLIFADEFDGDLDAWLSVGDGVWSVDQGEALQSNDESPLAFIYAAGTHPADVQIVAGMRKLTGEEPRAAYEITFRVTEEPVRQHYFCNWEPNAGRIVIMGSDGTSNFVLMQAEPQLPDDYDPLGTFTLNVEVTADQISCRVEEIPGASGTAVATPLFATGSFGLKTWRLATAFDFIRVYQIDPN
jgi:hypothetical protein